MYLGTQILLYHHNFSLRCSVGVSKLRLRGKPVDCLRTVIEFSEKWKWEAEEENGENVQEERVNRIHLNRKWRNLNVKA
jgi:hypothetical protein